MNLCSLLENNRDSIKRKNACARAQGDFSKTRVGAGWGVGISGMGGGGGCKSGFSGSRKYINDKNVNHKICL